MRRRSPVFRVWARGGLGNQLSSLSAAFVAASQLGIPGSKVVVDGSVVEGSRDSQRRFQLDRFLFSDSRGLVAVRAKPGNPRTRQLRSGIRRAIFSQGVVLPSQEVRIEGAGFEARRLASRYFIDGHHETTQVALSALDLGLETPFDLVAPTPRYLHSLGLINQETVGVHIRLGDFREWQGGKYILGRDYYREALAALGGQPGSTLVHLFSDEPLAAIKLLESIGVQRANILCSDLASPAEEFSLLARHRRQILSHSTFSMWAGLTRRSAVHVAPIPAATMTAPEGWIRIPS